MAENRTRQIFQVLDTGEVTNLVMPDFSTWEPGEYMIVVGHIGDKAFGPGEGGQEGSKGGGGERGGGQRPG